MKDCKFCHTPFEPKNPKGVFCSTRCRVYWNRQNAQEAVAENNRQENVTRISAERADVFNDLQFVVPEYPVADAENLIPAALSELFMGIPVPSGLKGIDLTIWKAEVREKAVRGRLC